MLLIILWEAGGERYEIGRLDLAEEDKKTKKNKKWNFKHDLNNMDDQ